MEILKYDHNGRGITYLNDKIVFVSNAIIGEDVEIKIIEEKKNYIVAEVDKYNKISSIREKNICPYFNVCGGCDIMHLPYLEQLKFKQNKVKEIINKFYGGKVVIKDIIYDKEFNYRNKVSLKINNKVGYYKKNSHDIINIDKCDLLSEDINRLIDKLNHIDLGKNKNIIIRKNTNGLMLILDSKIDYDLIEDEVISIYLNDKKVYGEDLYEEMNGLKFIISPLSFFQVNKYNTINLYNKILEYCDLKGTETVLDLYCGTGTIGSFVSKNCGKVIGIEINESAINDANINKRINGLNNIEFICGDSGKILKNNKYKNIDIVIVDPPRSGLSELSINEIININPKKIIYTSCDPVTLARDLKILSEKYKVKELTPVDMFPHTYHVESVCLLERD